MAVVDLLLSGLIVLSNIALQIVQYCHLAWEDFVLPLANKEPQVNKYLTVWKQDVRS